MVRSKYLSPAPRGKTKKAVDGVAKLLREFSNYYKNQSPASRRKAINTRILSVEGVYIKPYFYGPQYSIMTGEINEKEEWIKDGKILSFGVIYWDPKYNDWVLHGWNDKKEWVGQWIVQLSSADEVLEVLG